MKKGLVVSLFLFAIILLSLTFISASWFSDLFGPQGFTGKVTAGICGNGILEAGELCDGEDPLGDITSCVDFGFASGTLSCTSCRFDTSRCVAKPTAAVCGNGIVESGEQCDSGSRNGIVCGANYGSSCNYCSSQCQTVSVQGPYCGDGICNSGESSTSCLVDCPKPVNNTPATNIQPKTTDATSSSNKVAIVRYISPSGQISSVAPASLVAGTSNIPKINWPPEVLEALNNKASLTTSSADLLPTAGRELSVTPNYITFKDNRCLDGKCTTEVQVKSTATSQYRIDNHAIYVWGTRSPETLTGGTYVLVTIPDFGVFAMASQVSEPFDYFPDVNTAPITNTLSFTQPRLKSHTNDAWAQQDAEWIKKSNPNLDVKVCWDQGGRFIMAGLIDYNDYWILTEHWEYFDALLAKPNTPCQTIGGTTQRPLTPDKPEPTCTDSDDGLNYDVKGTLTYTNNPYGTVEEFDDYCTDKYFLIEGVCNSQTEYTQNQEAFYCSNGCSDGACIKDITKPTCVFTSASWSTTQTTEGQTVNLSVQGNNCNGQSVSFGVWEDDTTSSDDAVNVNPANVVFSGNTATGSWVAEWQNDGLAGDPEYYFIAQSTKNKDVTAKSGLLRVSQAIGPICGNSICEAGETPASCFQDCPGGGGPVCGNGIIDSGETCDDKNTVNGDGCSSICQIETPKCTDSDGGINYNIGGITTVISSSGTNVGMDICHKDWSGTSDKVNTLFEFSCDTTNNLAKEEYECPNGCSDGACATDSTPKPACKEGDLNYVELQELETKNIMGLEISLAEADENNLKLLANIKLEGGLFTLTSDNPSLLYNSYSQQLYTIELVSASDTSATIKVICGIIKTPKTPTCTDSDGGQNYDIKGKLNGFDIYGNEFSTTDYCADSSGLVVTKGSDLVELYCYKDTFEAAERVVCPNGCSDGACVKKTTSVFCKWFKFLPFCKEVPIELGDTGSDTGENSGDSTISERGLT